MYQDFLPVAVFIALAIILLVAPLIIQALILDLIKVVIN